MGKLFLKTDEYDSYDEQGVQTKIEVEEFIENGKRLKTFRVLKRQDTTLLNQKNQFERSNFQGFKGELCKTHSIPVNLYHDMVNKGIERKDLKEQLNYLEVNHPEYATTPKQLTKKRIVI